MAQLKEKILQSLKNTKQVENILNTLSKSQENLLKNYSNPVFNKKDRNKLLKSYTDLQDIGKSLYRYNTLQEHNYLDDAQEEKGNIENKVLKTGISYNKYVWHSESGEHTCEYCADLDGQEFDYYDEVPERPHPNCRCYVEIVKYDDENENPAPKTSEDEEPCDCWDKIDKIYEDVLVLDDEIHFYTDEIININEEILNYHNETQKYIKIAKDLCNQVKNIEPCSENCVAITGFAVNISNDDELYNKVKEIVKNNKHAIQTIEIFEKNKKEMEEDVKQIHIDKYYHAKANCESAELGLIQALWAIIWSAGKEIKDYYKKVKVDHLDAYKIFIDCLQDILADLLGLIQAINHGYCSNKVEKVEKIFRK